jgi:hypothetical protein
VVGVEGGYGEVAVGVGDAQRRRARLQLHERGAVELGEIVERDEYGEAGGVDGGGGGDSGEVIAVSVGEEAVVLQRRGRGPHVHRERQPTGHVDRHRRRRRVRSGLPSPATTDCRRPLKSQNFAVSERGGREMREFFS